MSDTTHTTRYFQSVDRRFVVRLTSFASGLRVVRATHRNYRSDSGAGWSEVLRVMIGSLPRGWSIDSDTIQHSGGSASAVVDNGGAP